MLSKNRGTMAPGHKRQPRSFKVETRHPTRKTGHPLRVSALDGPATEDYEIPSDDLPERDVRADLREAQSPHTRAEALFRKPGQPGGPPLSDRARAEISARTAPKGPVIEDDTTTVSEPAQATGAEPKAKPRILPNLLQREADPVAERIAALKTRPGRRASRIITALEAVRSDALERRPGQRQQVVRRTGKAAVQQSFHFDPPPSVKRNIEPDWPDDAEIAAREAARTPASTVAAEEAARQTVMGQPGAIDVQPQGTPVEATYPYARKTFRYNRNAVQEGLRLGQKLAPKNPNVVANCFPRHERWRLRRLPHAVWSREA